MDTGKVVLGVLAGVAVGAIAGILLAPEKGSTTRKIILDKSDDIAGELKAKYGEFSNLLAKLFDNMKNDAEELAQTGMSKFENAKNETKNAVSEFKHNSL